MKRLLFMLLPVLLCLSCSMEARFPGSTDKQVWTAMKAVAQQPDYQTAHYTKRWTIVDNFVDIDEEHRVIEIDRSLERILQRPMTKPLHEEVSWVFTVELVSEDPPGAIIHNRAFSLPTKFQFEAERYFSEVRSLLSGPIKRPVESDETDAKESGSDLD